MPEVILIIVVFIGLAVASRFAMSSVSKERRSMAAHRKTLEVMSKVTEKSSEPNAPRIVGAVEPVNLDLSRLDNLTDPDMIRVEIDSRKGVDISEPIEVQAPTVRGLSTRNPAIVIGEDDLDDDRTQLLPTVASDKAEVLAETAASSGSAEGPRRVYSGSRRGLSGAWLATGAGAAALALGVGFFLLNHPGTQLPTVPTKTPTSSSSKTPKSPSPTSSSQAATPTAYHPTSSSASGASYGVAKGVSTVVLTTTGASCWVEESTVPGGTILWDATLPPGSRYVLQGQGGSMWLRAGNSHSLSIAVNGIPVRFSSPPGPYNFDFVAGTSSS
ncbi:MAG: DUF4115 domain-containing protein [Ferrimicrobium sp.]